MSYIYETLEDPDEIYKDVEHGAMIAVKKINKGSIILAYTEEAEAAKIITLYYTSKLDRLIQSKTVRGAWKKVK